MFDKTTLGYLSKVILLAGLLLLVSACNKKTKVSQSSSLRNINSFIMGTSDHTQSIQKAIDFCLSNQIDTLFFPKGTYHVGSVSVSPGMVFLGEKGTILKKIPLAGKWSRMFTTQKRTHLGDKDSKPIIYSNLTFDGNKEKQGPYKKYELQQQHILYFDANPAKAGRVKGKVINCHFKNSVADGISLWRNADVEVYNCTATNVFRGGVVATGGHSKLYVENFKAGGDIDKTGIDIEVDAVGYGGEKDIIVEMKDIHLQGDFDANISGKGSSFIGSNIKLDGPGFFLAAKEGTVSIKNSSFNLGDNWRAANIYFPKNVKFENCQFYFQSGNKKSAGLNIYMETSYRRKGEQKLSFINCTFHGERKGSKALYALHSQENFTEMESNHLIIKNSRFVGDFDAPLFFNKGGNLQMENVYVEGEYAIKMNSLNGKTPVKFNIDRLNTSDKMKKMFSHSYPCSKDEINLKNIVVNKSDKINIHKSVAKRVSKVLSKTESKATKKDYAKISKDGLIESINEYDTKSKKWISKKIN